MENKPGVVPSADDDRLLDLAYADAASEMEGMVTRALQAGVPLRQLAVVVERARSGNTRVICASRQHLAAHPETLLPMDAFSRDTILHALQSAEADVLTVVVLAERDAYWACGVRSERGQLVAQH